MGIVSLFWGGDIILRENLMNVSALWDGYPHNNMTFLFKFFFIIQISYWLHIFPELYFQRPRRRTCHLRSNTPHSTLSSSRLPTCSDSPGSPWCCWWSTTWPRLSSTPAVFLLMPRRPAYLASFTNSGISCSSWLVSLQLS